MILLVPLTNKHAFGVDNVLHSLFPVLFPAWVISTKPEWVTLAKRRSLWALGYFCATVGAVDEQTIKAYLQMVNRDAERARAAALPTGLPI